MLQAPITKVILDYANRAPSCGNIWHLSFGSYSNMPDNKQMYALEAKGLKSLHHLSYFPAF